MKNSLQVGDQHGCVAEDTVPNYGFDVIAWEGNTLCVKSSVGESAFVESKGHNACDANEERLSTN